MTWKPKAPSILVTSNSLSKEDVKRLVYSYKEPAVTNELYIFGTMLLAESQQRAGQIDAKASTVLTWATGILALLFALVGKTASHGVWFSFTLGSGLFALLAVIYSFSAVRSQGIWTWLSDKSWFRESALTAEDELKRFHLRAMHDVRQTHLEILDKKSERLVYAEAFLTVAAIALFIGIPLTFLFPP